MNDEQDIEILDKETVYDGFFRMDRYRLRHRKFDGSPDPLIFLEGTVAGRSTLTGSVRQGKRGDGVFDLEQVTGISTATVTFLTDPAFRIAMTQP